MKIYNIGKQFEYDIRHLVMLFFPGEKLEYITSPPQNLMEDGVIVDVSDEHIRTQIRFPQFSFEQEKILPAEANVRLILGRVLYEGLSRYTGIFPKWGILTGIRPTKMIYTLRDENFSDTEIDQIFEKKYLVSPEKRKLMFNTVINQTHILNALQKNSVSLYISIPFCKTRCAYCSFVSESTEKTLHMIPAYVEALCKEIALTGKILKEKNISVQTIYIGGGTPTTLSPSEFQQIFQSISTHVPQDNLIEFTVEAGRADTITRENLAILKAHGTTRISINPQTTNQMVLDFNKRAHTTEEFYNAYEMAKEFQFEAINMDLIAGLFGDMLETFQKSVDDILRLSPENITLHTLAMKRSSNMVLSENGIYDVRSGMVAEMLKYAYDSFEKANFSPYYLYRQKNMRENLENVGFSKPGHENFYNVYMMDELQTVIGCGAGAVSRILGEEKIRRHFNFKFAHEYLSRFNEILTRKEGLREFL